MTPFDLIIWALAAAVSVAFVGVGAAVAVAAVVGSARRKPSQADFTNSTGAN